MSRVILLVELALERLNKNRLARHSAVALAETALENLAR